MKKEDLMLIMNKSKEKKIDGFKIFRISTNYPDFNLSKIIIDLPPQISIERTIYDNYCYDLKADNFDYYTIFKSMISKKLEKTRDKLIITKKAQELFFNFPYFIVSDNFNFNENLNDSVKFIESKNNYINNLLKSHKELISVNKKELNNNLSTLISTLYDIKKEDSDKIIKSVNSSVNYFFNKYPNVNYNYFSLYNLNSITDYIADKELDEFSNIIENQIKKFNINHDDKFVQRVINNALKNTNIETLSIFKNTERQLIKEDNYNELDKILSKKINDKIHKLPSIISSSRYEKFEFFNSYNILNKDYSEVTPVFKELLRVLFALKISNYQKSIFDKLDNLKNLKNDDFIKEIKKINTFILNPKNSKIKLNN